MYVRQIDLLPNKQRNFTSFGSSGMENQGDQDVQRRIKDMPRLQIGTYVLMPEFDDGDDFFSEKATKELRETPEVVQQALKDIRILLKGEPELLLPDDDEFFQKFLRPCKWYPKSTVELMKRFYKFRLNNPRYCDNLLPSSEKKVLSSEIIYPLPDRTHDGCRVLLINAGRKWNTKIISLDEIFRVAILSLDAAMAEPRTQIAGVHVILNMEGLSLSHVTHFTPSFASSVAEWVQRCLPCRLKGIHIVNQPFIFNMVFALFKPFLLEKTRKRIHFHGTDRNALVSHLGRKSVPTDLGGEMQLPNTNIGESISEYFCWFDDDFQVSNKYGYIKTAKR